MSNFILGALLGLLVGLAICYWNQIMFAYEHKDQLSAASNLVTAGQQFVDSFKV